MCWNSGLPASTGKGEMVYEGEQQGAEVVAKKLIGIAVKKLFDAKFPAPDAGRPTERRRQELEEDEEPSGPQRSSRAAARAPAPEKIHPLYEPIAAWFSAGNRVEISDERRCRAPKTPQSVPGLKKAVEEHFSPASDEEARHRHGARAEADTAPSITRRTSTRGSPIPRCSGRQSGEERTN
jgi:hypothetical protein